MQLWNKVEIPLRRLRNIKEKYIPYSDQIINRPRHFGRTTDWFHNGYNKNYFGGDRMYNGGHGRGHGDGSGLGRGAGRGTGQGAGNGVGYGAGRGMGRFHEEIPEYFQRGSGAQTFRRTKILNFLERLYVRKVTLQKQLGQEEYKDMEQQIKGELKALETVINELTQEFDLHEIK